MKTQRLSKKYVILAMLGFAIIFGAAITWASLHKTKAVDMRLTDMYGVTLESARINGQWVVEKDQEFLVWMDLPANVDRLTGQVNATYPYKVKAGETGTVVVKLVSKEDHTTYTGTLEFVAMDDLTLETGVRHKAHGNSGRIVFNNTTTGASYLDTILGEGKKTYMHFSLYTSCKNRPRILDGTWSGPEYYMKCNVKAIGDFDETAYNISHCQYCRNDFGRRACSMCGGDPVAGYSDWLPLEPAPVGAT